MATQPTNEELAATIRAAHRNDLPLLGFSLRGPILDRAWGVLVGLSAFVVIAYVLIAALNEVGVLDDLILGLVD